MNQEEKYIAKLRRLQRLKQDIKLKIENLQEDLREVKSDIEVTYLDLAEYRIKNGNN